MQLIRTYIRSVVSCPKDELRGSIVTRADVRDVGLALDEVLGAAKVAQLQHS